MQRHSMGGASRCSPFRKTALASAIALASSGPAITVLAQEAEGAGETELPTLEVFVEESIVTAQRRPEPLGDVPLGISAFAGEFLNDLNLVDFQEISVVTPGLVGLSTDSFIDLLQVRGIYTFDFGVGGDPSISVFKNGLYQGRNGPVVTSYYDVDRVEVARGPQGFLFGRNSIAGAINTITRRPEIERQTLSVGAQVGQYGRQEFDGVVNLPMGETAAARIATYVSQEDGFVRDGFDPTRDDLIARDARAVRFSLRNRTDATDVNLMVEYEDRERSGAIYRAIERGETWETLNELFDVDVPGGPYDSGGDLADGEADDLQVLSVGLEIERDLGWATFTSLTGYRDHEYFYAEDYDGSPLRVNHYHQDQAGDYAEQELRLVSGVDDENPLSWYAGVSWYRENIDAMFTTLSDEDALCAYYNYYGYVTCQEYYTYLDYEFAPNPDGLVEPNQVSGRYTGWAAYVDLNLALSETWDVGVGVRHTTDTKQFANSAPDVDSDLGPYLTLGFTSEGFLEDEKTWSDVAPRAFVRFRPDEDWTWFASATRGYKAGGFGSFALSPPPPWPTTGVRPGEARPDPFGPEQSVSYEAGFTARFARDRAQTRLNVYSYTFEDLQVTVPGPGGSFVVDNVGIVDGTGVEWELEAFLGPYMDVRVSVGYADTEGREMAAFCGDESCEGNGLGRMPAWSYGGLLGAELPAGDGSWIGQLEVFGQTEVFGGPSLDARFRLDGWVQSNLRFGYRSNSGWEIIGYAENATDERYFSAVIEQDGIIPGTMLSPNAPRTIGVAMRWSTGD